ncbi:hypothetical protein OUZ56_020280 [Daphnia magna]|uniref:Uncharacterized protein n=1 Tax=Daphnia magna TaxID=35525 RepID=A0ABQ9ZE23_9CRUS|nr:hypothetical protein OUZ56_020280 [Daphnia magna]
MDKLTNNWNTTVADYVNCKGRHESCLQTAIGYSLASFNQCELAVLDNRQCLLHLMTKSSESQMILKSKFEFTAQFGSCAPEPVFILAEKKKLTIKRRIVQTLGRTTWTARTSEAKQ